VESAVLVKSVKNIRQIDSRIRRVGAVMLLTFSVLLGLFLAKFLGFFSPTPPLSASFVVWSVNMGATVVLCRHAWSKYVKPHFFDR
jgi:hypothetical protein